MSERDNPRYHIYRDAYIMVPQATTKELCAAHDALVLAFNRHRVPIIDTILALEYGEALEAELDARGVRFPGDHREPRPIATGPGAVLP